VLYADNIKLQKNIKVEKMTTDIHATLSAETLQFVATVNVYIDIAPTILLCLASALVLIHSKMTCV